MKTKALTFNQLKSIIRESIFDSSSNSSQDAVELYLYIVNDSDLYHRKTLPIIANLKRKYKKGTYDPELAVKLWMHLADEGARQYKKEFGSDPDEPHYLFNRAVRMDVARELRDRYEEDVMEED